ncbi:class I SAM-dependent methyltransferase [Bauldia sp.]|uniref:class I SAM-dependent methyltransferase n=1 Tax=Bauldia sp. TaxID=2575872 RepID=UPI003BAC45E8
MTTERPDSDHWEKFAAEWIAWARTPGHDAFWSFREAFSSFVGQGEGRALDVGCGEGRISRLLSERGYQVTATDPVPAFVEAAREAGSAENYRVAPAAALPFSDAAFDLVVAYNVLMDVVDVPAAVCEMRRVLRSSGTLIVSIVHPFIDRGRFEGAEPDARFVVEGSYFGRCRFEALEERDGLAMHFAGWSQPLQNYMAALETAGLAITALHEPVPDEGASQPRFARWRRFPMFLWVKARPIA